MKHLGVFLCFCVGLLAAAVSPAGEGKAPDHVDNAWDASVFNYKRPAKMIVEQTTPTPEQINFFLRPPQEKPDAPAPQETGPAVAKVVGSLDVIHLRFRDFQGDSVPVLLCTPKGKPGPFPLVIATHGLTSNKAQVCAQVGPTLVARGYAVLAADMPCHGERPGEANEFFKRPESLDVRWQAAIDTRQLIDLSESLPQIKHGAGVVLVGYSMGSWISSAAGPADPRVKAMVLMVGGAIDIPAEAERNPRAAGMDPRLSLPHFAGRPLLLLNGRDDRIVRPDLADRLFGAAREPKQQIWYDSGHLLPGPAYEDAANWIAKLAQKGDSKAGP